MEDKNTRGPYIFVGLISLSFLAFAVGFVCYMMQQNREQSIDFLYRTARQEAVTIDNQIQSNWETLNGVAACIGYMNEASREELTSILKEINANNTFLYMGIADIDGNVELVDLEGEIHKGIDISREAFFQSALLGEQSISETYSANSAGLYINCYGVPIKYNQDVTGVLCAVNDTSNLQMLLDASIFNAGGYSNIIRSDGAYIVSSRYAEKLASNIDELGEFGQGGYEIIIQDLKEEKEDFVEFQANSHDQWAVYTPLRVNDWYILSTVPERVVNDHFNIVLGVVMLISFAFMIIIIFISRINQIMYKNRRQLEYLAYTDTLIDASNYTKFEKDMQNMAVSGHEGPYAFWYCDIDNFKFFNDLFGYEAGDQAIRYLSELIRKTLKEEELYCRISADKYAGIKYYQDTKEVVEWFQYIYHKMERYRLPGSQIYQFVLSMGIYCVEKPEDVLSVNDMQNRANMAQKRIKSLRSIKYAFYSEDIRKAILLENEMESHMHEALKREEFEVYIQPKVDIQNHNRIRGGEALVRWNSPEKGVISPGEFIPLFEKNGFVIRLDRYMFEKVCCWNRGYLDQGHKPLRIAVNVSRMGLFQEDFLEYYINIKEKYKIPDGILELEFTEGIVLDDYEFFRSMVMALQSHGFVCSMDDFGAGYSSLNILKELPIQVLKLDMLFFREETDTKRSRIVIGHVIKMAKELNIATVSEGVEKWEQVEFLQKVGCDVIQGYVFAKPMPIPEFEKLVESLPDGFRQEKS